MQPAVIIEQSEWEQFTARLAYLEKRDRERDRATAEDAVFTVRDVARQLHMSEEAVRRARRERRLTGFKIDEKHYGFRQSEVTRYLNRYNRMAGPGNDSPDGV